MTTTAYFDGIFNTKDKRTVVLVAAGGAVWLGCCAAAYITWRRWNYRDSFYGSTGGFIGSKSQKSQHVINELRKVNEEMVALRQDVNGVKVLVKQLRRDIAELRCLERNGAITLPAGNFMLPLTAGSSNEFRPIDGLDGYNEDDESELEFRSAKSETFDAGSRARSPVRFAPTQQQRYGGLQSPSSSDFASARDFQSPLTISASDSDFRATRVKRTSSETITAELLAEIDAQLDLVDNAPKRETLRRLELLHSRHRDNAEVMWRLGRALYYESELVRAESGNSGNRKEIAYRAKDLCFEALSRLSNPSAGVYKWCALTLGNLQEFESISNKIKQGYEFRTLIEKAIELDSNDPLSHYLLGRWFFGCYQLTWYERKIAATLFATPPSATVDEALGEFLKCSELLQQQGLPDWKENCLYIAKCYIEKRDTTGEAQRWLKSGEFLPAIDEEAKLAGQEIQKLLAQYG